MELKNQFGKEGKKIKFHYLVNYNIKVKIEKINTYMHATKFSFSSLFPFLVVFGPPNTV